MTIRTASEILCDPSTADNLEVRKKLLARFRLGEISFDEMQAELRRIKLAAYKDGREIFGPL